MLECPNIFINTPLHLSKCPCLGDKGGGEWSSARSSAKKGVGKTLRLERLGEEMSECKSEIPQERRTWA